jgi:hypothetical protein
MKSHYCPEEKTSIVYEGQCNWCGEKEMNNEPVAWIKQNPETLEAELHFDKPAKYWATVISNPDIPLYTHPAKTLTDEEIISCIDESEPDTTDMIRFARAILRKAQEK